MSPPPTIATPHDVQYRHAQHSRAMATTPAHRVDALPRAAMRLWVEEWSEIALEAVGALDVRDTLGSVAERWGHGFGRALLPPA